MGHAPGKLWRMYVVDATGGLPQEIKPDDPVDQGVPSWSADGKAIVFGERRGNRPDDQMTIRVLDLATKAETILPGSRGKWSPRWSPDGRSIVASTTNLSELDLFDCASRQWRTLVRTRQIDNVSWSHDGRWIHFTAWSDKGYALYRVRVADGKVEQLALHPEFEDAWTGVAPDGSPLALRAVKIEEVYALDLKW